MTATEPADEVPRGDLLRDTTLTPDPDMPGRYHGTISEAWKILYAFGGVTMTASLRAMQTHLNRPELQLVTANALFCAPVPCGPVVADVSVLRNGRGAAQVACDLSVPGQPGPCLRTHGVFGRAHDTPFAFTDVRFPDDVLPPDECPRRDLAAAAAWPVMNLHRQTESLPALPTELLPWPSPDRPAGPARFAGWSRLLVEPRLADGTYDPVSLGFQADSLGGAVSAGIGGLHPMLVLSLEIGLRFLRPPTRTPAWILGDQRCWQCGDGYATGPTHLWDEDGNLLAIAQQTAHLRNFPG